MPDAVTRNISQPWRRLALAVTALAGSTMIALTPAVPAQAAPDPDDAIICTLVSVDRGIPHYVCTRSTGGVDKCTFDCPWAEVDLMTQITLPPELQKVVGSEVAEGLNRYMAGDVDGGLRTLTKASDTLGANSLQVAGVATSDGIPMPEPAVALLTAFGKDLSTAVTLLRTPAPGGKQVDPKQISGLLDSAVTELTQAIPK